jgi:hypothetical protein
MAWQPPGATHAHTLLCCAVLRCACAPARLRSGMAGRGASGGAAAGGGSQDPGASLAAALFTAMARREQQQRLAAMAAAPGPGLSEVLKPEVLVPLLQDPEVCGCPGWCAASALWGYHVSKSSGGVCSCG